MQRHHENTACGERMSAKWTCGDVLCASYVGKEQNSRSYSKGKCMVMKKRLSTRELS